MSVRLNSHPAGCLRYRLPPWANLPRLAESTAIALPSPPHCRSLVPIPRITSGASIALPVRWPCTLILMLQW